MYLCAHFLRCYHEQLPNVQILGADGFTLSTTDAVLGLADAISIRCLTLPFGVQSRENIRNRNLLGADLGAVPAAGAGNQGLIPENGPYLFHGLLFLLGEGLKVLHKGDVVFHLLLSVHAGH